MILLLKIEWNIASYRNILNDYFYARAKYPKFFKRLPFINKSDDD